MRSSRVTSAIPPSLISKKLFSTYPFRSRAATITFTTSPTVGKLSNQFFGKTHDADEAGGGHGNCGKDVGNCAGEPPAGGLLACCCAEVAVLASAGFAFPTPSSRGRRGGTADGGGGAGSIAGDPPPLGCDMIG